MSQKRRKCKLANSDYADVDLRQFEQTILDVVNETVPNKNPKVFEKYFSTDVLTQSEAVLLGRALAKIRGKEISIANIVKALEVGFSIELMHRLETLKKEKASLEERYISCKNKSKDIALDNKAKLLKKLGKYFITSSDPDIKLFLKNNIECITIDHNDITIEYIA